MPGRKLPPRLPGGPLKAARARGGARSALSPFPKIRAVSRDFLFPKLPALVGLGGRGLAMRSRLLLSAARCLWARRAACPARRHRSCGGALLEELFARGGPLRTFLERQAGAEAQLQARGPELVAVARLLSEKEQELRETEHLLHDENEDLRKLAENEITLCQKEITQLKHQIILLLVPSEETNENDLILEVTAGVGGQEAMLFTSEIFDMYQQYAAFKRWHFETLEYFPSEIGGLRHASASIGGSEAYKHMKFEGGVHRVQRVPKTEKQGRIHTSTMTVAILPQPTEINLVINPKDLRIDTKRASGAGGQHVNTTDSAVRIVHLPTGRRKRMRRKIP
ncbi:peptide chain release factor 1-like, mitochondrial isoform X2 [Equus quagga]|uniref:peptide chain release factor 1-like, mitochondrial isoform X2 n=1 Tax=Equus quagga TaxID=89248 RepID=UPI001D04CA61|nr:peptide chain release factor 1-like, mitochondrial isoform X2 [Equus asinus]XP_046525845.1 peptide chain release factor 1-like, mitochondrial isoform X2 [Equus quagga]